MKAKIELTPSELTYRLHTKNYAALLRDGKAHAGDPTVDSMITRAATVYNERWYLIFDRFRLPAAGAFDREVAARSQMSGF